ncbi:MAG: dual OB domain-containing protein [Bacillota bacterium]
MKRDIVCFANSRKTYGKCFAGKDLEYKNWIRPVSTKVDESLSLKDECLRERDCGCTICIPTLPSLLDVVSMEIGEYKGEGHQVENYLYVPKWELAGAFNTDFMEDFLDETGEPDLWVNGYDSEYGKNDIVPVTESGALMDSLRLIEVEWLVISVKYEGEEFNKLKKRARGLFKYKMQEYNMIITDEAVENKYLAMPEGQYVFGENRRIVLCLSLDKEDKDRHITFNEGLSDGCFNKHIAGVIEFGSTVGLPPRSRAVI